MSDEPEDRLEPLEEAKSQAIDRCHYRTAARLSSELRRAARDQNRLRHYVSALHTLTNSASDLLDPEAGREAAVELIAVLESEDRARQIQPDLDLGEYEWLISRVSSCAYDNLAKSTAMAHGYNSEGLHGTLAEGIQICRRTGKLECINCFREYATDVHRASDDLEMALHHAGHVEVHGNVQPGSDRRWAGAHYVGQVQLYDGRLDAAESAARRAMGLVPTHHNPLRARLLTLDQLETIRVLKGEDPADSEGLPQHPADEYPAYDLCRDLLTALRLSARGEHDAALRTLTRWDRLLNERGCLEVWFDVRLRLIAAHRLAGRSDRLDALARPLEARARESRDWLTLRRLAVLDMSLREGAEPPELAWQAALLAHSCDQYEAMPADDARPESSPLEAPLQRLYARLGEAPDSPDARAGVLGAILAQPPGSVTHPMDAVRLLHLANMLQDDPARGPEVWDWAEALAAPFAEEAAVLNLLACLGGALRDGPGSVLADRIDPRRLAGLFRRSLDLDPSNAGNFARAGAYHLGEGDLAEAERCLARGSRLDRSDAFVALRLAEIYRRTDRARDALAVLDMSLREGAEPPELAWQAALLAHSCDQYEAMLTYLDRFDRVLPASPWVDYYRADGLLRLGRPEEALAALDREWSRFEEGSLGGSLHLTILRACVAAPLGRLDDLRKNLVAVLETRLSGVDYLTQQGLVQLFERLREAASALPEVDPLRPALDALLLATGLAPGGLFQGPRMANPKAGGIGLYICTILQRLDDDWSGSSACLAGEEEWTGYRIAWGVLARDEDEVAREALAWQARCWPGLAEVEDVQLQQEGFDDHPGAVWQGLRSGITPRED